MHAVTDASRQPLDQGTITLVVNSSTLEVLLSGVPKQLIDAALVMPL